MKVLHVHSGNMWGGVEATMSLLARRRDITPSLHREFALSYHARLAGELADAGASVFDLGVARLSRPWSVRRSRQRLLRVLHGGGYRAVITHNPWALAVFGPAVVASRTTLVAWMHGPPSRRSWLDRLAARTPPSRLIANSYFTAEAVRRLFPDLPCDVCYPPAEPPRDVEEPTAPLPERGADQRIILMASRMEPLKGHLALVSALARLRSHLGWTCWIAGAAQSRAEERYERRVRRQVVEEGLQERIRFLGHRRDVPALLRRAWVLCQPNIRPEAFGLAFVEALQRGVPVVTSDLGGAREVIVDDGCGILVPPADPQALARVLATLIEDSGLRDRLGAAGPARALYLSDPRERVLQLAQLLGAF